MKIIIKSALIGIVVISLLMVGGYFGYQHFFGEKDGIKFPDVTYDPYTLEVRAVKAELRWTPETLADLVEDADVVVRGYLLDNAREEIAYGRPGANGVAKIQSGYTLSTLVVVESYEGSLLPGDKIPFAERYYNETYEEEIITETKEGRYRKVILHDRLVTYNDYMPAIPYTEYVFFLSRQPVDSATLPGYYMIRNMEMGRYPFLNEKQLKKGIADLDNQGLGVNLNIEADKKETYLAIYQEIVDIYIDPPTEEEIAEMLAKEEAERLKAEGGDKSGLPLIPLIGGGVAVIAVAGGAGFFILSRRKKKRGGDEAVEGEPEDKPKKKRGLKLPFGRKKSGGDESEAEPKKKRGLKLPFGRKKSGGDESEAEPKKKRGLKLPFGKKGKKSEAADAPDDQPDEA